MFSFKRPGALNALTNPGSVLSRTGVFANITNADPANPYADMYVGIPALRTAMGVTHAADIATYLLDALLAPAGCLRKGTAAEASSGTKDFCFLFQRRSPCFPSLCGREVASSCQSITTS